MNCPTIFINLLVCSLLVGCSPSGPKRYDLRGQITYKGQPVPSGTIYFDPDTSKGNDGPGGCGEIKDGQFKTNPSFGAVCGPHKVRINGPSNNGQVLFSEYITTVDIPKDVKTLDFAIDER